MRDLEQARTFIDERLRGSYRDHGFGMWLTVQRSDHTPVGLAGLVRREGLDMPDVGYAFVQRVWGRGYAQEAAAAVLGHAQGPLGIQKLAAITSPENFASMAVLRKIGFTYHGMIETPEDQAGEHLLHGRRLTPTPRGLASLGLVGEPAERAGDQLHGELVLQRLQPFLDLGQLGQEGAARGRRRQPLGLAGRLRHGLQSRPRRPT